MIDLTEQSPWGTNPQSLDLGEVSLHPIAHRMMTLLAPYPHQAEALDLVLRTALGLPWPDAGEVRENGDFSLIWMGKDQAMLVGAEVPVAARDHALCSDQSDGWCGLRIEGPAAGAVLAHLIPIDLRSGRFSRGQTARTMCAHFPVSVRRIGDEAFELMSYRSMAGSFLEHLETTARRVVAGNQLA